MEADGVVSWVVGVPEVEDAYPIVQALQYGRLLAAEHACGWDPGEVPVSEAATRNSNMRLTGQYSATELLELRPSSSLRTAKLSISHHHFINVSDVHVPVSCVPGRFIRTSGVLSATFLIQSHVFDCLEQPLSNPMKLKP